MFALLPDSQKIKIFWRKPHMGCGTIANRAIASELSADPQTQALNYLLAEISSRSRLHRNIGNLAASALGVAALIIASPGVANEAIKITDAWVHAADQVGGNIALSMTIKNEADAADALMRVRCPVANFSEKHIVDRGEGAPAMRAIPSIPIAAGATTTLKADAYHVMLLQTRQALVAGQTFNCSIAFQKAGTIETEVKIRELP
jgi:periplasmic copper chaperone A